MLTFSFASETRILRRPAPYTALWHRGRRWIACGALLVGAASSAAWGQEPPWKGQKVAEVRVLDDTGQAIAQKLPALPLHTGMPFNFSAERASLRALYRTGDYSDIRVTALPVPGGLRVDFLARRNYYNNVIRIVGLKPPPTEATALAALRLNLGEPFRKSSLEEAMARLQDTLREDGFYQAKMVPSLDAHEASRQMDVTLTVVVGPRARVGTIRIENQTPYSDRQLLRRLKLSGKDFVTAARLSHATQRLKQYLVNQGYLGAAALLSPGDYVAASNRLPLRLSASAGPRVRVEISGARLSKAQQRKLLPIYAEGAVDKDLLQEGRRNIRDYFQNQGYFDAHVAVGSPQNGPQGVRIIGYEISRGARYRLAGISFSGNRYFSTALLTRRLQLQPASFASNGRFSQQLVRDDADSIRSVYLANGFHDVQVSSTVDGRYHGKKNNLFVSFHIVEGPQARISALALEGNRALATSTLLAVTGSTPGQPYSESGVASDRNNILALYYNEGFPEARFRDEALPGGAPNQVRLIYHITEGRQIKVAKVLLTGYQYTHPGIIARQVEIHPGGPLREGDVAGTQRNLYNLGVFTLVQVAPQNPAGADPQKNVVVAVQEGQRYTIGYGFGFEVQRIAGGSNNPTGTTIGASPRGIFEISRANMFGRAQTLSFKARASTLEYRAALEYTADNFLSQPSLSLQATAFADKTQDINTFTSTRFEGGLQLVEQLSPSSSLLYRYFYRRVKASNLVSTINPEQIPLLSQPTLVSGFGITYARDRRDNPADAAHGSFNTVDFSDAIRAVGSSASFLRGFYQNSSYYSLGRSLVFARSVRFGVEQPMGNTVAPSDPSCIPATSGAISCVTIPLPERFFAGGGTSLRGFGLNQAGPRDPVTGFPIGGLALLEFNQELRFPMNLPWVGNRLGGTIFYDGGNVYSDLYHISFAWKSPSTTNLSYFSHTVGFGLRYPTPVGPVRIDFGYQLNPALYQATFTPAGSTTPVTDTFRLPHFGFFFDIGPVF